MAGNFLPKTVIERITKALEHYNSQAGSADYQRGAQYYGFVQDTNAIDLHDAFIALSKQTGKMIEIPDQTASLMKTIFDALIAVYDHPQFKEDLESAKGTPNYGDAHGILTIHHPLKLSLESVVGQLFPKERTAA